MYRNIGHLQHFGSFVVTFTDNVIFDTTFEDSLFQNYISQICWELSNFFQLTFLDNPTTAAFFLLKLKEAIVKDVILTVNILEILLLMHQTDL